MPFADVLRHQRRRNLKDEVNRRENESFSHLFEAIILAQSPAVAVAVDGDLHRGRFAHDTVCHAGASLHDSIGWRERQVRKQGRNE